MSTSVADGKLYVTTGHTHLKPLYRGSELHCLDADTGKEIWKVSNFGLNSPALIADGSLVVANGYDNSIYCFGKGTTATHSFNTILRCTIRHSSHNSGTVN